MQAVGFTWEVSHYPARVMMVCTGNICRSVMAHRVLAAQAGDTQAELVVDSSGISDEEHGNPIDRRAVRVLQQAGYPSGAHQARQIQGSDLAQCDLILAMTSRHHSYLERLGEQMGISWGQSGQPRLEMYRVFTPSNLEKLGQLPGAATAPNWSVAGASAGLWRLSDLDVPDPWYGGPQDFLDTLDVIEECTPQILATQGA